MGQKQATPRANTPLCPRGEHNTSNTNNTTTQQLQATTCIWLTFVDRHKLERVLVAVLLARALALCVQRMDADHRTRVRLSSQAVCSTSVSWSEDGMMDRYDFLPVQYEGKRRLCDCILDARPACCASDSLRSQAAMELMQRQDKGRVTSGHAYPVSVPATTHVAAALPKRTHRGVDWQTKRKHKDVRGWMTRNRVVYQTKHVCRYVRQRKVPNTDHSNTADKLLGATRT